MLYTNCSLWHIFTVLRVNFKLPFYILHLSSPPYVRIIHDGVRYVNHSLVPRYIFWLHACSPDMTNEHESSSKQDIPRETGITVEELLAKYIEINKFPPVRPWIGYNLTFNA